MTGYFVILVHVDHLKAFLFSPLPCFPPLFPFYPNHFPQGTLESEISQFPILSSSLNILLFSFSSLQCIGVSPSPPLQSLSAVHQLDSTALAPPPLNLFISTSQSLKILVSSPISPRWSTRHGKTIACLSSTSIVCPSITISGRTCSMVSLSSTWGSSS